MKHPPVHLHLGAHKTATTHLQSTLQQNRQRLAAEGVGVLTSVDETGDLNMEVRNFTLEACTVQPKWHNMRKKYRLRRQVRQMAPSSRDLIVYSDEDLLGMMHEALHSRLYIDSGERLGRFVKNSRINVKRIFLSVREYSSFFRSLYIYHVGRTPVPPINDARSIFHAIGRGWPDIIRDVRSVLPSVPLTVWRYETYDASRFSFELTGIPLPASSDGERVNQAPTLNAIQHLSALSAVAPLHNRHVDYLIEILRRDDEQPIEMWTLDEIATWSERYERDLERIADMKGVRVE